MAWCGLRYALIPSLSWCPHAAALRFFNKVGEVAEAEGHHPDLHLSNYRQGNGP